MKEMIDLENFSCLLKRHRDKLLVLLPSFHVVLVALVVILVVHSILLHVTGSRRQFRRAADACLALAVSHLHMVNLVLAHHMRVHVTVLLPVYLLVLAIVRRFILVIIRSILLWLLYAVTLLLLRLLISTVHHLLVLITLLTILHHTALLNARRWHISLRQTGLLISLDHHAALRYTFW